MNGKNCCHMCEECKPGCHSKCEKYKAYRIAKEEMRAKRLEERRTDVLYSEVWSSHLRGYY